MARRIADKFKEWEAACDARFEALKANEEELNRLFIDIYGLSGELTPDVEEKYVTVRRAQLQRDIKSLLSYAVGCIFGRYSHQTDGIVYAGGEGGDHWEWNEDNIVIVSEEETFDNDLARLVFKWVETVYGRETLEDNLQFIADALGGKGTPREVIRQYLLSGFYADHLKMYQKRPIYWLFSSGKKNGFKALVYMHRYTPDLLSRLRTDYVRVQSERYRLQARMIEESLSEATPADKAKRQKKLAKLHEQEAEMSQFDERLCDLAQRHIAIDLNDGVKRNYAKLASVLEPVK